MTESQLRQVEKFSDLPIYDENDEAGCDKLLRVYDTSYEGSISEAEDNDQFKALLDDRNYDLKGAIRYSKTDVRPVFWKKRSAEDEEK